MPNEPLIAPTEGGVVLVEEKPVPITVPTGFSWKTGWKAVLGALVIAGSAAMQFYNIPGSAEVAALGASLMGLGLASKAQRILTILGQLQVDKK